ncbi:large exoprotein [Microbacterium sp. SA156]|uniref:large exoprotein n=1 Tax=Microbacterium TaxID=33882 RepID=UPI003BA051F4
MYDDVYGPDSSAILALAGLFAFFGLLIGVVFYVLGSWFLMKIFDKAGVQGRWRAWVPVYNMMVFFKLGDLSPWLVLYGLGGALLLSWIGIGYVFSLAIAVLSAMAAYRVGLKLQKEGAWVVLYVFLSLVWLGINAFDKSRWNPNVAPASWAGNGFLGDRTVWDGVPTQPAAAPGYGQAAPAYGQPAAGQPGAYPPPPAPGAYPPPADATGAFPPAGDAPGAYPPPPGGTTPPSPPAGDDRPPAPPAPPAQP